MFIAGTLKKLKVSALNLFLEKHQLGNKRMKKSEKLVLISACLAKAQLIPSLTKQSLGVPVPLQGWAAPILSNNSGVGH